MKDFNKNGENFTISPTTQSFFCIIIGCILVCSLTNFSSSSEFRSNGFQTDHARFQHHITAQLQLDEIQPKATHQPMPKPKTTHSPLPEPQTTRNCYLEYIKTVITSDQDLPLTRDFVNMDHRYDQSLKITCNDETCTNGSWYDCDCKYAANMATLYDAWRTERQNKARFIKKIATLENLDEFDINKYREAEACLWKPEIGTFKVLSRTELVEKLKGKQLSIIGDSEARNMYTSLVSWLRDDPLFHEEFHKGGRWERCWEAGFTSLFYDKKCSNRLQLAHPDYEGDGFVIHYLQVTEKLLPGDAKAQRFRKKIWSDVLKPYYILSLGFHGHHNSTNIIKTIETFDLDQRINAKVKATFISPPLVSDSQLLKYRKNIRGQAKRGPIAKMNSEINNMIKKNKPDMRLIDYSMLSKNLFSKDGYHYGPNLNKVLLSIYFAGL